MKGYTMKMISREFPEGTIGLVHQSGRALTERTKGFTIHLLYHEASDVPCGAEVDGGSDDHHAEIGLWFDGKVLVDYDGVFELPLELVQWLRELGFTVEDER